MVTVVLISYLDDNHGFFFMILHNVFVIVRKGTFKSHAVVLLDNMEPYVSTFEHVGYLKLEPAQFYTVDLLLDCPELHCADEVKLSPFN